MHTVAVLEQALHVAKKVGFKIREEWLDGAGGGYCEIRGKPWIFLDAAQSPDEQLAQVVAALQRYPRLAALPLPPSLRLLLRLPEAEPAPAARRRAG